MLVDFSEGGYVQDTIKEAVAYLDQSKNLLKQVEESLTRKKPSSTSLTNY